MRAVLLAHPAGHSLSPVLQNAAFEAAGLDVTYEAWDVPPERLAATVAALRDDRSVLGANVTVPHKRTVMATLDGLDPDARAIGAVNVLRRTEAGLVGGNSDGAGFLRSLAEAGLDPAGRSVLLVGAGGAARAVGWSLAARGVASLSVANRTFETAEDLVAAWRQSFPKLRPRAVPTDELGEAVAVSDVVVNATSVGMERGGVDPDESPLPASAWAGGPDRWAVDLVYRPRVPRFLRDADAAGLRTIGGLGMLLHQGAVAFEAWTGRPAPVAEMRAALHAALAGDPPDALRDRPSERDRP